MPNTSGDDSSPTRLVNELQLSIQHAKMNRIFARVQSLYDTAIKQALGRDTKLSNEFLVKARQVDALRTEFSRTIDLVNEYQLKLDPEYVINYSSLDAFDDLYCVIQDKYASLVSTEPKEHEIRYVPRNDSVSRLQVPKFNGTVEDWPVYYQLFKQSVDNDNRYTDLEKVTHLANSLQGPARIILSSIAPTAENYRILLKSLQDRYEDKRALASVFLDKIIQFKPIINESEKSLTSFMEGFIAPVQALKQLNLDDLTDCIFVHIALNKLDPSTVKLFENNNRTDAFPKLDNLIKFVSEQCKILGRTNHYPRSASGTHVGKSTSSSRGNNDHVNKNNALPWKGTTTASHTFVAHDSPAPSADRSTATFPDKSSIGTCSLCTQDVHPLYLCQNFRKMNIEDRWNYVKSCRVCFNCLSVNSHYASACRSTNVCPYETCKRRHHKMLHRFPDTSRMSTLNNTGCSPMNVGVNNNNNNNNDANRSTTQTLMVSNSDSSKSLVPAQISNVPSTVLLATATVIARDRSGTPHELRCLLDSGSQSHFITKNASERLGLNLSSFNSTVSGIGLSTLPISAYTTVAFSSKVDEKFNYSARALVVDQLSDRLPTARVSLDRLHHLKRLILADDKFYEPHDIDLLIGSELWPSIVGNKKRSGPLGTPTAISTTLGYIVMGKAELDNRIPSPSACFFSSMSLEELVEKFWSLDEVPSRNLLNPEDERSRRFFIDTTKRKADGTFTVRLPFREPATRLGSSLEMAIMRFISLERKLDRNVMLRTLYVQLMNEYIADGTISRLGSVADVNHQNSYLMPHHGVYRPGHVSTPLRIVWNASAATTSSCSLNDLLLTGPKLQKDIFEVLLHFRLFPYAVTADVRRMFLQIEIDGADRCYQRFIWRETADGSLDVYQSNKIVFGMSCSPYLAQETVRLLARLEKEKYPLAAAVIERDLYVDDVTSSCEDEGKLIELHSQLECLFKSGGFTLAKWCSNSDKLLRRIPEEMRLITSVEFDNTEVGSTKVLGVQWLPTDDSLIFVHMNKLDLPCTKRNVLSVAARIFDPLGLIAPVTLVARLIVKSLWKDKIDWDEPPPLSIVHQWNNFQASLTDLTGVTFPRHIGIGLNTTSILIGFADSSENAYGSCLYIRTETPDKVVNVELLCAKSRVAPSKVLSIPRLELCAAVMLSKMMRFVMESFSERHSFSKVVAFSDSKVVLHWIHSEPSRWKTFVSNRIAYIHENLAAPHWRHVSGEENPADVLSRGTTASLLLTHSLWFHGPSWLSSDIDNWPPVFAEYSEVDNVHEEAKIVTFHTVEPDINVLDPMLDRMSSYRKLLRATAYVFRACTRTNLQRPFILREELVKAEKFWLQKIQEAYYRKEIDLLRNGKPLPVSNNLRHLDPFYEDGVLRVGGRLANAQIPYDQKHPILLPPRGRFVDLVIDQFHFDLLHAGAQTLLTLLRLKFWIPGARTRIRNRIRKCNPCFRVKPVMKPPKMADLPALRVSGFRAFEKVGIDYAGPFSIVPFRQRGKPKLLKSYFCLFICLAVKAVHVELVSDLTTECFLAAFKRFLSRRGPCSLILSDGGSTFVGARRQLSELEQLISSQNFESTIGNEFSFRGIEWRFNPPFGPSFGGLWESNIKCVKNHLKRFIGNQLLTYEEFNTVLIQIEAILNSRPLCALNNEPSSPSALTPAHFLTLGSTLEHLPALDLSSEPLNRLQRFQLLDRIVQDYWRRWKVEYLHGLQTRAKWTTESDPIKKGTLVLIMDEKTPPLRWDLAVVEELYPGKDGAVRVVSVRTPRGVYRRPVIKLCPLPTQ